MFNMPAESSLSDSEELFSDTEEKQIRAQAAYHIKLTYLHRLGVFASSWFLSVVVTAILVIDGGYSYAMPAALVLLSLLMGQWCNDTLLTHRVFVLYGSARSSATLCLTAVDCKQYIVLSVEFILFVLTCHYLDKGSYLTASCYITSLLFLHGWIIYEGLKLYRQFELFYQASTKDIDSSLQV